MFAWCMVVWTVFCTCVLIFAHMLYQFVARGALQASIYGLPQGIRFRNIILVVSHNTLQNIIWRPTCVSQPKLLTTYVLYVLTTVVCRWPLLFRKNNCGSLYYFSLAKTSIIHDVLLNFKTSKFLDMSLIINSCLSTFIVSRWASASHEIGKFTC